MATVRSTRSGGKTLADLLARLGGVPLDRVRAQPAPGSATLQDVIDVQDREGILCELVDGVLLEKTVGLPQSRLAALVITRLTNFVLARKLGVVTATDSTIELMPDLVRIPDAAFTSWDRMPNRTFPTAPVPRLVPNLAVEVLSRTNTAGEMAAKRRDYFAAGVQQVWEIDDVRRVAMVYHSPTDFELIGQDDRIDGGVILPGFQLPLAELFADFDQRG
jgi:Uma2 family endonuclease